MKHPLSIPLLLFALSALSVAQAFHWNWRHTETAKSTIAKNNEISAMERVLLLDGIAKEFKSDPQARERAAATRIKVVDLNGDGVPEIIVQAVGDDVCSPTGNCPFWLFQRTASGYRLILKRGAIQSFTIQPTRTTGYFDLVLGMHGSATEQGLYVYQFSHEQYRRVACYDATWTYMDKNNEAHDLKEPRISQCR